jgi:hypothetical protein
MATHHQIDFPIADPCFLFNDGRAVINRDSVGNGAFISGLGRNTLRLFLLTQVSME